MDPTRVFDMERRTGIASDDVEDFANRMDMIAKAMEEIKDGTFDPAKCKIPGFKTPEQEETERKERERKEEERRRREEEKARQDKQDEHDKWWHKAKLRQSLEQGDNSGDGDDNNTQGTSRSMQWANRVLAAYKARDANDYSVWDAWVPEDPVSREERAEREAELEKLRNREFEANNPDFCNQFKQDLEARQRSQQQKERDAEKLKRHGNNSYKRRKYQDAVDSYMKALELAPFNVAVLANIAQCYLRLELDDDCVEFCSRALFVDPNHIKALSRRATVWHRQKKLKDAAEDMRKALVLDPENPDVVEQHSIIVGDYEDSITSNALDLAVQGNANSAVKLTHATVEELRFVQELMRKMDDQVHKVSLDNHLKSNQDDSRSAKGDAFSNMKNGEAGEKCDRNIGIPWEWAAYDLALPFIERNGHVRDQLRTSGELFKLCERLCFVFDLIIGSTDSIDVEVEAKTKDSTTKQDCELIVTAMLNCAAAALASTPRNQVVLFRQKRFRDAILALLGKLPPTTPPSDNSGSLLESLAVQASLLRVVEETIDSKKWKQAVLASQPCLSSLLRVLQDHPVDNNASQQDVRAAQSCAISASSICFTISNDASGINALMTSECPSERVQSIARSVQVHSVSDSPVLINLLGFLTNMTTSRAFRASVEGSDLVEERRLLVKDLLLVARRGYTAATVASPNYVITERALAVLLNLSFQESSPVRQRDLLEMQTIEGLLQIFSQVQIDTFAQSICILSRAASLLCRLHVISHVTEESERLNRCQELMSETTLLRELFRVCEQAFESHKHSVAVSDEIWQACAQVWCHFGWCAHIPTVRAFLREKQAQPLLFRAIDLSNNRNVYRKQSQGAATISGGNMERLVGNIVKVLIALEGDHHPGDYCSFAAEKNIKVLVEALQSLPDGLARKNVAILLAKLCQCDADIKNTVRSLRGIEMMVSISQSLQKSATHEGRTLKVNQAAH